MSSETEVPQASEPMGLSVSAVARRMGVAPATLRTWDRRYGVGPGEHLAGSHRRYGPADLARLEHMRRLVIAGISPSEAARAARELVIDEQSLAPVTELAPPAADGEVAAAAMDEPGRAGGGRVVPLPGSGPAVRGLARAAQSLDTAACAAIMDESIRRRGVVWTWDNLVVPVLVGVGQQWSNDGRGIEVEHALSAAIQDALSLTVRSAAIPQGHRSVLLACAPDELHSLPLWAVAGGLAERGIGARILGASMPTAALRSAVQRLGPAVVFIWAQIPGTADPFLLEELPSVRPAPAVLIGGPGWQEPDGALPDRVEWVSDLADTVARIAHAVGE